VQSNPNNLINFISLIIGLCLQPKVPGYVVRILEKQAEFRTLEDLETIADLMDGLQSFRKYSRQMQLSMCRIVRYMKSVFVAQGLSIFQLTFSLA